MAVEIGIDASVSSFLKRIDTLSDAARKEAAEIADALDKGIRSGADAVSRSVDHLSTRFSGFGGVAEKALKKLGGTGNEVADVLFDFAIPIAEMATGFGAAGVAAAGLGAAVVGVGVAAGVTAAAVYGITNAAVEARDRLTDQGLAAEIPADAQRSLAVYESSLASLRTEVDLLVVSLGGELSGELAGLNVTLAQMVRDTRSWTSSIDENWNAFIDWTDTLKGTKSILVGFGLEVARGVDQWMKQAEALAESERQISAIQKLINDPASKVHVDTGEDLMALFIADATKANEKTGELKKTVKDTSGALDEMGGKFVKATEDIRSNFLRITPKTKAELEGITVSAHEVGIAVTDSSRKLSNASQQDLDTLRDYTVGVVADVAAGIGTITDLIIDNYERRVAAGQVLGEAEMRNANRLDALAKAAQITAMSVAAISTWFSMTRDLALIPGNAVAAPFEAAGIVLAGMIAPAAQILGEPVPFPNVSRDVGDSPTFADPVEERGTAAGYADAYGAGNLSRSKSSGGGALTIDLSRAASQLLRVTPGKSGRGTR